MRGTAPHHHVSEWKKMTVRGCPPCHHAVKQEEMMRGTPRLVVLNGKRQQRGGQPLAIVLLKKKRR
jgi:hypothetical protein